MDEKINILITGKNGYIGNYLYKYLENDDKFNIDMLSVKDDEWKKIDFSKYNSIIHLAGIVHKPQTEEDTYEKVNYELTINIAKMAKKANANQFIFFSTGSVYGDITGKITKDTEEKPNNFYGKSKLKAEKELQNIETKDFKVCIVRPPMVYGKNCKGNYCSLSKIAKKTPIFPKIDNKRSMIYIENLCEFTKLLVLNKEAGKYYPQDKEFINTSEMVKLIADINNHKILISKLLNPLVFVTNHVPGKIGRLSNKAFGNWYYDKSMSDYKQNYTLKTVEQGIHYTET